MPLCTVRDCRLALRCEQRTLVCPRGHSFDIARSGYVNLLQPQDKKSKEPGDTAAAVAGRRRLHDRGVTAPLLRAIAELARPSPGETILDAGCGEGFYLGSLAKQAKGCSAHGIDISIPAIEAAAKRYPDCEWIVANADRFVPFADASFSLVLSITARLQAAEFRRVLRPGGRLLVALPAPDDLIELRGKGRDDRAARTIADFSPAGFKLVKQGRAATSAALDADAVHDVLHSIYRPIRPQGPVAMSVTFSFELLLFGLQ
jgi:23S rRNA (guanine745-N1)-methyltransferase